MMNKHINYLFVSLYLILRRLREYKSNLWSAVLIESIYVGSMLFFMDVLNSNFADVLKWNSNDFIVFFFFGNIIYLIFGLTIWNRGTLFAIKTGELNTYLARPLNTFWQYLISNLAFPVFVSICLDLVFFALIIYFKNIVISNFLFILLFSILIIIVCTAIYAFVESLNFIKLGLGQGLRFSTESFLSFFRKYPYQFFENSFIQKFLFIFPIIFISSILIPLAKNISIWRLDLQIIILVSIALVFSFLTYLNWKKGLKKYGGYN